MAQQWWGDKEVQSVRDAVVGDPGFEEGQTKVVVVLADGSEHTVARSEVSSTMKPAPQSLRPGA